jgi:hypothetical protein
MASAYQIDSAAKHDRRKSTKPMSDSFSSETVYVEYEKDRRRLDAQRRRTLDVLRYYRDTDLVPTNRRLIPDTKDYDLLMDMIGLEDIG